MISLFFTCALTLTCRMAQDPTPTLAPCESGRVVLEVRDRCELPVQGVRGDVFHFPMGLLTRPAMRAGLAPVHVGSMMSDSQGEMVWSEPVGFSGPYLVRLRKSGYAEKEVYWLWSGFAYRTRINIGAHVSYRVLDSDGKGIGDARVQVWRYEAEGWPHRCLRSTPVRADEMGRAEVHSVPNGRCIAVAIAGDSAGILCHQVSGAFGHEEGIGARDLPIVFGPSVHFLVTACNEEGENIDGISCSLDWSLGCVGPQFGVKKLSATDFQVGPLPELPNSHRYSLRVSAPGYHQASVAIDHDSVKDGRLLVRLKREVLVHTAVERIEGGFDGETEWYFSSSGLLSMSKATTEPGERGGQQSGFSAANLSVLGCRGIVLSSPRQYLLRNRAADDPRAEWVDSAGMDISFSCRGAPLAGALVHVGLIERRSSIATPGVVLGLCNRTAITDPNGRVRFRGLIPGQYSFQVNIHGDLYSGAGGVLALVPGALKEIPVEIGSSARIKGVVRSSRTGDAVGFGTVVVRSADQSLHYPIFVVGQDGSFEVSGLEIGVSVELLYLRDDWACDVHRLHTRGCTSLCSHGAPSLVEVDSPLEEVVLLWD
jgi:hypothetical protein